MGDLDLAGRDVLVLGLGVSGRSAAAFCAGRGARVVACDERPRAALAGLDTLESQVELVCGGAFPDPAGFDLVVPSPGVPPERYAARARRVAGDVELAARELAVPLIAVTGTNGKSTVTRWIEALLRAAGLRAEAAGNLGRPCLELVGRPIDAAVLEVSSFQLETTERFRPRVALILNLSPDHLDRHGSFTAYTEAKARILANQEPGDCALLNAADPAVLALAPRTRARVLGFHRAAPVARGGWLDAGALVLRLDDAPLRLSLDGVGLRGRQQLENALAAMLACAALGADATKAACGLADLRALPHRLEPLGRVGGVAFVNDSKATNVAAAVAALENFEGPLVWLAGGRAKGADLTPLAAAAAGRVRSAFVFGEAAAELARVLGAVAPAHAVDSLDTAVRRAAAFARPGELVLLAPACSSLDQFAGFEARGERFRAAVAGLAGASGALDTESAQNGAKERS